MVTLQPYIISTFIISGIIPSKKNNKFIVMKDGKPIIISSEKYRDWEKDMMWVLRVQNREKLFINYPVSISFRFYSKTKRKFDLDNKVTSLLDLLVKASILDDDNYNVVKRISAEFMGFGEDKCEIIIQKYA